MSLFRRPRRRAALEPTPRRLFFLGEVSRGRVLFDRYDGAAVWLTSDGQRDAPCTIAELHTYGWIWVLPSDPSLPADQQPVRIPYELTATGEEVLMEARGKGDAR